MTDFCLQEHTGIHVASCKYACLYPHTSVFTARAEDLSSPTVYDNNYLTRCAQQKSIMMISLSMEHAAITQPVANIAN